MDLGVLSACSPSLWIFIFHAKPTTGAPNEQDLCRLDNRSSAWNHPLSVEWLSLEWCVGRRERIEATARWTMGDCGRGRIARGGRSPAGEDGQRSSKIRRRGYTQRYAWQSCSGSIADMKIHYNSCIPYRSHQRLLRPLERHLARISPFSVLRRPSPPLHLPRRSQLLRRAVIKPTHKSRRSLRVGKTL